MKKSTLHFTALTLAVTLTATVAASKYSGIYSGKIGPLKFLAAITAGGRVLGLDSESEGLRDALDPSKSTVNKAGRLKGVVPNGTTVTAKVSSKFRITGTAKNGGQTFRLTGKRTYK